MNGQYKDMLTCPRRPVRRMARGAISDGVVKEIIIFRDRKSVGILVAAIPLLNDWAHKAQATAERFGRRLR
jgi:hypothetical protein